MNSRQNKRQKNRQKKREKPKRLAGKEEKTEREPKNGRKSALLGV